MLENKFQANLIKELKERFPGCIVMKNDPTYIQGIPDLLVLHKDKWASLECKKKRWRKEAAESGILCGSYESDVVFKIYMSRE